MKASVSRSVLVVATTLMILGVGAFLLFNFEDFYHQHQEKIAEVIIGTVTGLFIASLFIFIRDFLFGDDMCDFHEEIERQQLDQQIVDLIDSGISPVDVATQLDVSLETVEHAISRR